MKTSAAGRKAIKASEANKLKAYKDGGGVWTIGIGHTAAAGPPKPVAGMTITAEESEEIFARDLVPYEQAVSGSVKVPISQNQFDAMVSLCFNIGQGAFKKSSLVKKLNKGDYGGAADAFLMWNKDNGKVIPGLTKRRQRERKLFLTGGVPLMTPIAPKPMPAAVPITDKEKVKRAQAGLALLNYNPGGVDGIIGPLTAGAIIVFRAENNLPAGDFIDDEFMTALVNAKPRAMVPSRANATAATVAAVVPEAKAHSWNKIVAIGSGAATAVGGLIDQIGSATGYLQPVKDFLGEIPTSVWIVTIVTVAGVVAWNARSGQKASDEAYRTGDRR